MKIPLAIVSIALLSATGCEQAQQAKESYANFSKLREAGKEIGANFEKAQNERAERVKRGDTLSLPYKELEGYLPQSVSGYTPGELKGESQKLSGMAFSSAERTYTKAPDAELEVAIIDYNGAGNLYQGAAAVLSLGMEQEDDEQKVGPTVVKVAGVKGMDTLHKKEGRAEMTLAVGGRFLLTLKANQQQDMALLKSVAESMDLAKLARM